MKDFEELQQKTNKILSDLEGLTNQEWKKKRDLVEEYIITNRILLEHNKLSDEEIPEKKYFCSYIVKQLENRGIAVHQNGTFYGFFSDDEKFSEKAPISTKSRQEISSDLDSIEKDVKVVKQRFVDSITEYLEYEKTTYEQVALILDDLIEKYPEFKDEIKLGLGDLPKLIEESKEVRAVVEDIAKHTDLRNKALEFKKIKALLLEKIEFNIAKVANLIHISPKHMSANIMKNEQEDLMNKARWFEVIDVKCSCGKENVLDIANWFDRQVERMTLSLPFKKPTVTHVVK